MLTIILAERQKYRTLRTLLQGDKFHLSHCECRDKRKMLRRPREDIAKLRTISGKPLLVCKVRSQLKILSLQATLVLSKRLGLDDRALHDLLAAIQHAGNALTDDLCVSVELVGVHHQDAARLDAEGDAITRHHQ